MDYYHYHYYCPYQTSNTAKQVYCDGGCRINFPSIALCREYIQHYCADPKHYMDCTIAQVHEKAIEKKIAIQKEVRAWRRQQQKSHPSQKG